MTIAHDGRLLYGGDYNPEQWPEEVWADDVRLMKEAGVTSVTLGVFSWAKLEPTPGAREFGWLDRLMDLMHAHGIGVVLATPTASPPPWLGRLHPKTLPRDENGQTVWWGSRQQFAHSSRAYRRHASAITEDLAIRYGHHPALRMWHINNEYCTFDYGDEAARAFRDWLRTKYGTLAALNEAWGTAFWSQHLATWADVIPPRRAQYLHNPAQVLDFRRFTSDALLECYTAERDIVRRHSPARVPVTTNFMPLWIGQDAWAWAEREDVVSVDVYPDPRDPLGGQYNAMIADMTRSQAHGPWMVMEQAAGPVNWRGVNHPKPRGLNRLWSLQTVARGADAVCYFQWRQSRQGAEKFHSGMVGHAGEEGRAFAEVKQIGAELAELGSQVAGTHVAADVAVLHDWHSWWAGCQDGRPSAHVTYEDVVRAWHRALWEAHLTTDFAHPEHDLSAYKLVVVPHLYLLTDAAIENLLAYVRGGGTLVAGFFTGVADADDRVRPGGMDARLRALFGIRTVHEWWPLDPDETVDCGEFTGTLWSEELTAEPGTEVSAVYRGGELDGLPAVLRRDRARYLSTLPEPPALRSLLEDVAAEAGVRPPLTGLPAGVEAVRRGELLFLLHHGRDEVTVALPDDTTYRDLLTGAEHSGSVTLGRFGVAILALGTTTRGHDAG
ncbi:MULTISPECIES: beta-galactosidase [unclassified Streptomyces]|uniref:Beta-galactosidase n=1 Tax=Streptomyces sp. NBC_00119 TaxID=2975659 RepID=A0AAU1UKL2_9ACTN|nr:MULTISPECIES: beta-galactosidase [unclassified Streptomyces]MCX4649898.1 beta-galactosidase [Streptomyces sp. NBC_01446]MCX5320889.1 beta-galactosidase [Streptomyces sp. NBC_00120]